MHILVCAHTLIYYLACANCSAQRNEITDIPAINERQLYGLEYQKKFINSTHLDLHTKYTNTLA